MLATAAQVYLLRKESFSLKLYVLQIAASIIMLRVKSQTLDVGYRVLLRLPKMTIYKSLASFPITYSPFSTIYSILLSPLSIPHSPLLIQIAHFTWRMENGRSDSIMVYRAHGSYEGGDQRQPKLSLYPHRIKRK